MGRKHVMKYIASGLFLVLITAFFVPLIIVWDFQISVFDFLGFSSDLNAMLDEYAEYTEFLQNEIDSYRVPCILLMLLPICEAVLVFFLKEKQSAMAAGLALAVNNTVAFILYDNIQTALTFIKESLLGTILQVSLHIEPLPVIIWIVVHVAVFIIIVASVTEELVHRKREKDMTPKYEEKEVELMEEKSQTAFYGGIIGETGAYKGKVYLLKRDEKVTLGSEETDDIFIIGVMEKATLCMIAYDTEQEEYHVRPLQKKAVFMKNMQPLGKDRVYCIPRGKSLVIDNKKNLFTLA